MRRDDESPGILRFYRTIKGVQPTRDDFLSDEAAGGPPPRNLDKVRYWHGFSVFDTLERARAIARKNRHQGRTIAEMTISADGPIKYERWGRNPGHHTVWGHPDICLAHVTNIYPVFLPTEEQADDDPF
jgi:hypothetical protein